MIHLFNAFLYPFESKLVDFVSFVAYQVKQLSDSISPSMLSLMQGGVQWLLTAVDKEKEEKA